MEWKNDLCGWNEEFKICKWESSKMNKENIMKNLDYFLIPENSLYQWLEKKHLDPDNKLSDEKWEEFVEDTQDQFGDHTSDIGKEFLQNWINGR